MEEILTEGKKAVVADPQQIICLKYKHNILIILAILCSW